MRTIYRHVTPKTDQNPTDEEKNEGFFLIN